MLRKTRIGSIGVAATCVLAGGAIGISQSAAAGTGGTPKTKVLSGKAVPHGARPGMGAGIGGPGPGGGGGAVHSVSEVLDEAGTAYISQTTDSGTVTAVDSSAGTVTLEEGTSSVTYATPTVTIPSDAVVTLDGRSSSLGKLATGDHVMVTSSSEATTVFATDASFGASHGPGGGGGWSGAGSAGAPPSSSSAG